MMQILPAIESIPDVSYKQAESWFMERCSDCILGSSNFISFCDIVDDRKHPNGSDDAALTLIKEMKMLVVMAYYDAQCIDREKAEEYGHWLTYRAGNQSLSSFAFTKKGALVVQLRRAYLLKKRPDAGQST